MANREGAKDAKENDFFPNRNGRFGKDSSPPGKQRILSGHPSSSIGGAPFSEADRLFSFADLRIGKRKLSVLGALSEAGGSSFSLGQLAPGSKDLSALRITL